MLNNLSGTPSRSQRDARNGRAERDASSLMPTPLSDTLSAAASSGNVPPPAMSGALEPPQTHKRPSGQSQQANSSRGWTNPETADPLLEFEEYGAELGKEARVWKVYVKETEKWDTELVEGWNKSLDVILVFAALFAAVATAFLIESSKRLQQDPADVSAEALVVISQTLLAMAGAQTLNHSSLSSVNNTTSFQPTNHTIVINTLWYLSLSLSIATSLMAMLAKDWCHSFISNRNGHPWIQARRRQKKWMMIEQWKMEELLLVLPSLIHLSLLLFAIGLCVYVYELNETVAISVIVVTVLACSFYILSSVTASIVEFFPYTTIISKIMRSECMRKFMPWLFGEILVVFLGSLWLALQEVVHWLITAMAAAFAYCVRCQRCLQYPCISKKRLENCGLACCCCLCIFGMLCSLGFDSFSALRERLRSLPYQYISSIRSPREPKSNQDNITSHSLSWLIKYCENPSSIAIVLQSIAGAGDQLPREPLEDCEATLHILRRLVSNDLYKDPRSRQLSLLYSRALQFLGSNDGGTADVGVMIWELHLENEKHIVDLISKEQFVPSDDNLQALRIGSIMASNSLRYLNEDRDDAAALFTPLNQLLSQIHGGYSSQELHRATLSSLVNAMALSCACSPTSTEGQTALDYCMKFLARGLKQSPSDLATALIAIMSQRPLTNSLSSGSQPELLSRTTNIIQALLGVRKWDESTQKRFVYLSAQRILEEPRVYGLEPPTIDGLKSIRDSHHDGSFDYALEGITRDDRQNKSTGYYSEYFRAISPVHLLTTKSPPALTCSTYILALECMCISLLNKWDNRQEVWDLCHNLINMSIIPEYSQELLTMSRNRRIIALLRQCASSSRYGITVQRMTRAQIWLLSAMAHNSTETYSAANELSSELRQSRSFLGLHEGATLGEVKKELEDYILGNCSDTYSYRIAECILHTQDAEAYTGLRERVNKALAKVPQGLRNLPAFISTPPPALSVTTQPGRQPPMEAQASSTGRRRTGDIEQQIADGS